MPRRPLHVTGAAEAPLRAALRALRTELAVPGDFPPAVLAEAEAAAKAPRLPAHDATDLPFVTVDPPASTDLDQALHLARRADGGYRVHYAIADVAAFVAPGSALDAEAHRRVLTLYFPDGKVPLHPAVLSEGAASLLPGEVRPAVLWRIDLDAEGRRVATDVRRALVRSRAKLDYAGVQRQIDSGTAEEPVALLREIGRLREAIEIERGGISLDVPEQEIVEKDHGYDLVYRAPFPSESWNAQISLLTGMAAADLMTAAGTGILRTLDASSSQVGLVNAASYAPFLLVTLLVGVWVDRVRRRPLMITANVGRALLVTAVPLLAVTDLLRIEFVYVAALLIGALTVVFDVAYQSYLPTLIGKEHLVEGNSKLQGTSSLAQIGGPGLAGLLIGWVTAPYALLINGASYLVSVVTLLTIRRPEPPPVVPERPTGLWKSVGDGIRIIWHSAHLRACALQSGLYNFCWMSLQTVFVLYAARRLDLSPGTIGLLLGTGAVGSLGGSLVARSLKRTMGLGPAILAALVLCCAAPVIIPLAPANDGILTLVLFVAAFALIGAGGTMANIHIISLRQSITPDELLGRMNAGYRFVSWGMLPLGALLGGWLGDLIGLRETLFVTAGAFLSAVLVVLLSPVWRLKDFPPQIGAEPGTTEKTAVGS
ncbi:MFS transporter [Streptomyces sp. NPDC096068]|uniref:MFS transporter n=1 Tax=Streptomyces sp. NPDC096068 TaxID=3155424 RepID=UPI0033285CB3